MFHGWGFLMMETMVLLVIAALLGLLVGWLIWGRKPAVTVKDTAEADRLRAELASCQSKGRDQAARIGALEGDLSGAKAAADAAKAEAAKADAAEAARADAAKAAAVKAAAAKAAAVKAEPAKAASASAASASVSSAPVAAGLLATPSAGKASGKAAASKADSAKAAAAKPAKATAKPAAAKADAAKPAAAKATAKPAAAKADAAKPAAAKPAAAKAEAKPAAAKPAAAAEKPAAAAKPKTLTAARGGKADDLKLIKGVGPKMEALLHKLGFFHFDQMAAWTAKELAWVDDNLEDFKGRASREEWVQQAKDLAAGKPPRKGGEN